MLSLSLVSWLLFLLCCLFYFFLMFINMNNLYFSFFLINNSFLINYQKKKRIYKILLCIWALWFRQNRLWTEGKPVLIGDVLPMENQILTDFLSANPVNSGSTPTVQRSQVQFSKPIPPLVKVNFDGAVFQDLSKAGVGVVVRDSHGMVFDVRTDSSYQFCGRGGSHCCCESCKLCSRTLFLFGCFWRRFQGSHQSSL